MVKVAIPIFKSRVSPVFDTCAHLLVIDFHQGKEIQRQEIYLDRLSLTEREPILKKLDVTTFICGGISETLHNMLKASGKRLIIGIAGEVDKVLAAFLDDRLDEAQFQMPGYKAPSKKAGLRAITRKT